MKLKGKSNPQLYSELVSKPYPSQEIAEEKLNAFFEELYELRKKYEMADILLVIRHEVETKDGPSAFMTSQTIGDPHKSEILAAWALGQLQRQREELIGKYLKGSF